MWKPFSNPLPAQDPSRPKNAHRAKIAIPSPRVTRETVEIVDAIEMALAIATGTENDETVAATDVVTKMPMETKK